MISKGAPAINSSFLTESMRNVVGQGGGIYHALAGTLIVTGLTAVISVPVGVLTAIYLVEYGQGNLARSITFLVDVMTGIPSIVAGLFAYALFVIFFGAGVRMGFAGAVALSLLMIPLVVRSSEEMLKLVPQRASRGVVRPRRAQVAHDRQGRGADGSRGHHHRHHDRRRPDHRRDSSTADHLRATDSTNFNPFNGRIMTLPVYIFSQYAHPGIPPQFSIERAWGAALVLTVIVMVLNLAARLVSYYFSPRTKA